MFKDSKDGTTNYYRYYSIIWPADKKPGGMIVRVVNGITKDDAAVLIRNAGYCDNPTRIHCIEVEEKDYLEWIKE